LVSGGRKRRLKIEIHNSVFLVLKVKNQLT
jgi:hypothetical protein